MYCGHCTVLLRPIYTIQICRIQQAYDRPMTWLRTYTTIVSELQVWYTWNNSCRRPVVSLSYATKSYCVNQPLEVYWNWKFQWIYHMEWRKRKYFLYCFRERKTLVWSHFRIWAVSCDKVKTAIVDQIQKWTSEDNCEQGGEKCLYAVG